GHAVLGMKRTEAEGADPRIGEERLLEPELELSLACRRRDRALDLACVVGRPFAEVTIDRQRVLFPGERRALLVLQDQRDGAVGADAPENVALSGDAAHGLDPQRGN